MTNRITTGLCDADGVEIFVGARIKKPVDCNQEVHGDWAIYEVRQQGLTPLLTYIESEKGKVLPTGYAAAPLSDEYPQKMFCFARDSLSLRPIEDIRVVENAEREEESDTASGVSLPAINSHALNEATWRFLEALPDGELRALASKSRHVKRALQASLAHLESSFGPRTTYYAIMSRGVIQVNEVTGLLDIYADEQAARLDCPHDFHVTEVTISQVLGQGSTTDGQEETTGG